MTATSSTVGPEQGTGPALGACLDDVREADLGELAAALDALSPSDLERLSRAQAEIVIAATQRVINALSAIQAEAVTTYADETDRRMEEYERQRREDFVERRDAARDRGLPFTERWHPVPGAAATAAAELAPLLRVSPRAMATRISRSRRLVHHLSGTSAAARRGDLEPYRCDAVVRASELLDVADLEEYEVRVLAGDVMDLACSELARRARRAAAATDRAGVEAAVMRARARRGVRCGPDPDLPGLTRWQISLPTDVSDKLWAAVDELGREYHEARRSTGEPVTLDQARADALTDLVLANVQITTTLELVVPVAALAAAGEQAGASGDAGPGGPAPVPMPGVFRRQERRSPAEVLVGDGVADPVTLALVEGRDLHLASELEAELALELMGYLEVSGNPHLTHHPPPRPGPAPPRGGPDPASPPGAWFVPGMVDTRRVGPLLPDDITRLLADPDTRVRVLGSSPDHGAVATDATVAYRPGRRLASRVRRRDGTCRFPGCGTPAERCQLDHVTPWPAGQTSEGNLVALCASHHGFKHHAGWRLEMTPEGACTWTAPTGREHRTYPAAVHDLAT